MPVRRYLVNHSVATAFELGWSGLSNGELLSAAEEQFDALITTDQHLHQQQNLANRKIAILVLPFASWPKLERHISEIVAAIEMLQPGDSGIDRLQLRLLRFAASAVFEMRHSAKRTSPRSRSTVPQNQEERSESALASQGPLPQSSYRFEKPRASPLFRAK